MHSVLLVNRYGSVESEVSKMLVDLLISRAAMGAGKVDVHRSAVFVCGLQNAVRKIERLFH